jgi:hypothetical protein
MEQYIIVKVKDSKAEFPSKPYRDPSTGRWFLPDTNLAKVRKAIHEASKEQFIGLADMVTHTPYMSKEDSETIAEIFNRNMERAKRNYRKS